MRLHTDKRSRDFDDEPRSVRRVLSARLPAVRADVRTGLALFRVKSRRSYVRYGCKSVYEWAEAEGYGYQHARRLVALGRALTEVPGLLRLVRWGKVPPESAVWVACLFREPALDLTDGQKARVLEEAAALSSREFRDLAEKAIEDARQGEPTLAMRFLVTRETRKGFRKVKRILGKGKDRLPSDGQVLGRLVRDFLARHDPAQAPPPREPARTADRKRSRYRTRRATHEVEARSGGTCEICGERRARHMIHLVPYGRGGGQEARNTAHACAECHFWYDLGVWRFAGFGEDGRPRFEFRPEKLPDRDGDDPVVRERAPPLYVVGAT